MSPPRTTKRRSGGAGKLIFMGLVPALVLFLVFFYDPEASYVVTEGPPVAKTIVRVPELDSTLLATVQDDTHEERLLVEPDVLSHLLENSVDIVPSVAQALGLPDRPEPPERLRARPDSYRGRYLRYSGQLRQLSAGKPGHPRTGYGIHEGWIETDDGEWVAFRVSLPPHDIALGDYVRVQGFFMKLLDSHARPRATAAPLLVGPELILDFPPWTPVETLVPEVLAEIDDRLPADGSDPDAPRGEVWNTLPTSQYLALWHLTSFARTTTDRMSADDWRAVPALTTKEQLLAYKNGEVARGTPARILGTFIVGQTWEAHPNPLGIEAWSHAWVQVKDLGGKLIPVWVPGRIDNKRNDPLEIRGFFFRRFAYDTERGGTFAPLFVAARLDPFAPPPPGIASQVVKWTFVGLVVGVIVLLFVLARRDRARQIAHEKEMDDRRRRRRAAHEARSPSAEAQLESP